MTTVGVNTTSEQQEWIIKRKQKKTKQKESLKITAWTRPEPVHLYPLVFPLWRKCKKQKTHVPCLYAEQNSEVQSHLEEGEPRTADQRWLHKLKVDWNKTTLLQISEPLSHAPSTSWFSLLIESISRATKSTAGGRFPHHLRESTASRAVGTSLQQCLSLHAAQGTQ